MEKVVRGLLLSSHPDEAKVAVLRQLLPTCRPTGEAASHALYRLASELLLGPIPEPTYAPPPFFYPPLRGMPCKCSLVHATFL